MGDIFTHSKVTVSKQSNIKQTSAQMLKLARIRYSFLYAMTELLYPLVSEAALLLQ